MNENFIIEYMVKAFARDLASDYRSYILLSAIFDRTQSEVKSVQEGQSLVSFRPRRDPWFRHPREDPRRAEGSLLFCTLRSDAAFRLESRSESGFREPGAECNRFG
jgi:hypothetical protein